MLLQALILNQLHIGGIATPFVYIVLTLKAPSDRGTAPLMLEAFIAGLAIDILSNSPGMNAAATVALAFARGTLLKLFMGRDMQEAFIPGAKTMGWQAFLKYATGSILLHHALLLSLEYASLAHPITWLGRILACTACTLLCLTAVEKMTYR